MRRLTLPLKQLHDLSVWISQLESGQVGLKFFDIRITNKLVDDIAAACGEYGKEKDALLAAQRDLIVSFEEKLKVDIAGKDKAEKELIILEANKEINKRITEEFGTKFKELDEKAMQDVTVELSEDKFSKAKELFKKFGAEKYPDQTTFLLLADALGFDDKDAFTPRREHPVQR